MSGERVRKLVDDYVQGWESGDASRILGSLSDDCLIIESHGPSYHGPGQVQKWISEWFLTGSVDRWSIDSFVAAGNTAFFEWSFTCTTDGNTDSIDGATVVRFNDDKICHLHEYRMTRPAFNYFES